MKWELQETRITMSDMERDSLIEKMNQGFSELTPDCWEEIKGKLPEQSPEPVEVKARPVTRRFLPAIAAAVLAILAFTFVIKDMRTAETMLYIDVNPSVSISLNRSGRVISVKGINEDGRRTVAAVKKELKGIRDPEKAAVCIITQMDREGYFKSGTLDAIISLSYGRKDRPSVLDKTGDVIKEYAESKDLKTDLILQSFVRDKKSEKTASGMGISAGKYEYIIELADGDETDEKKVRKLADKTTGEINRFFRKTEKKKSKKAVTEEKADPALDEEAEKSDKAEDEAKESNGNNAGEKAAEKQNESKRSVKENPSAGKKAAKERKKVKKYTKKRVKAAAGKKEKKAAGSKKPKKKDKA